MFEYVVPEKLMGVQQVQVTELAFDAIRADGSIVTWGAPHAGGDSSAVQDQLKNVQQVQATSMVFAAILTDESVVTCGGSKCWWGQQSYRMDLWLHGVMKNMVATALLLKIKSRHCNKSLMEKNEKWLVCVWGSN